jgi:hypothetical protein
MEGARVKPAPGTSVGNITELTTTPSGLAAAAQPFRTWSTAPHSVSRVDKVAAALDRWEQTR